MLAILAYGFLMFAVVLSIAAALSRHRGTHSRASIAH